MRWRVARCAVAAAAVLAAPTAASAEGGPEVDRGRDGRAITVVHDAPDDVPTLGPRQAPVTIEFFCNFNGDRNHRKAYETVLALAARHPRRVRIEFHIVGNQFSEAAYEAFDQGVFLEYARAAFDVDNSRPRPEDIERWAVAAGANYAEMERALADQRHRPRIERAEALRARRGGQRSSILSFNGEFQARKAVNVDELEDTYDMHFRRAKQLLDDGVPVDRLFDRLVREAAERRSRPITTPGKVDRSANLEQPPLEYPKLVEAQLPAAKWPSLGPPNARVVLVLACSLQSETCRELWRRSRWVREVYDDEARLVFLPLFEDDVHPDARLAHEATLCARDQGNFWELVEQVFRVHRPKELGLEHLRAHAEKVELDVAAFEECATDRRHSELVDQTVNAVRAAGVRFTPSLVIGGRIYVGLRSRSDILALVERELQPGLLERARELRRQILETLTPSPVDPNDQPPVPQ